MAHPKYLRAADLSGAAVSTLCAVHCAITPLVFVAKPILESPRLADAHQHGASLWAALDFLFLILSLAAVWYSAGHTAHRAFRTFLWIFWGVFACGLLLEANSLFPGEWMMYAGSITLAATHLLNFRYCRACNKENCKF